MDIDMVKPLNIGRIYHLTTPKFSVKAKSMAGRQNWPNNLIGDNYN